MERRKFIKAGLMSLGAIALSKNSWALKYYPNKSAQKWAVLYGTWCGSSRDAGVWISEGMGGIADVYDVRENPDLSKFDHVVVGGSIRYYKTSQRLQDYLAKNKNILKNKIRGFWCVCGNMKKPTGPAQVKRYIDDHLSVITGVSGVPAKVFNGRITLRLLKPKYKEMMKNMGDYDMMTRTDFLAFGKKIFDSTKV